MIPASANRHTAEAGREMHRYTGRDREKDKTERERDVERREIYREAKTKRGPKDSVP